MEHLVLVRPSDEYAGEVMDFQAEMLQNGDSFDGCAGLEDVKSYAEWADFEPRLKARYGDGYVPSEAYLAVRPSDRRLIGILDFRLRLSPYLLQYGGNIGYSVRPSERRKGYGAEMLRLALPICRAKGCEDPHRLRPGERSLPAGHPEKRRRPRKHRRRPGRRFNRTVLDYSVTASVFCKTPFFIS